MSEIIQFLAHSDHGVARSVRRIRRAFLDFTVPAPAGVVKPILWGFVGLRSTYHFIKRVAVCEPLFKAYCARYGEGVRTGVFVHWVQGKGSILLGSHVLVDGKSSFTFTNQYTSDPTLEIGDRTYIGHDCSFTVGRRITIGSHCLIARGVWMFDASGHPTDPATRLAGKPAPADRVKPIVIGDNVWIGGGSQIFPGTMIGEGSVIAAGSIVRGTIPRYSLVAGNPATVIRQLQPIADDAHDMAERDTI